MRNDINSIPKKYISTNRSGFTLVEMMVAVALVLLMMSLFASIFVNSTEVLATQRGIAENDQRGRMLSLKIRGDIDGRTFRDVLPLRSTVNPSTLLNQAGYLEIDEGNPDDDTDDVLQLTVSLDKPASNINGTKSYGACRNLTAQVINSINVSTSTITIANTVNGASFDFSTYVPVGSYVRISGTSGLDSSSNIISYDGRYQVSTVSGGGSTSITVTPPLTTSTTPSSNGSGYGYVLLSESDPEFDDGIIANASGASTFAEVCYFLRAGNLYRRVLLVRDSQAAGQQQPSWGGVGGTSIAMSSAPLTPNSFWHDFDYSAFLAPSGFTFPSNYGPMSFSNPTGVALFQNAQDPNFSNPFVTASVLPATFSLGLPFQRFGHSVLTGMPQDSSTVAKLTTTGNQVFIGRFNQQECASSAFGYPGVLLADPVSGMANTSPFDRANIQVNPATGMVAEYTTSTDRRGQDILLANVLTFDVKLWDPINGIFVNLGDTSVPNGPFSPSPQPPGAVGGGVITDTGLATGNIVGGRLNSTYGPDSTLSADGFNHYRFDTWHPNAAVIGSTNTGQPPYYHGASGGGLPNYTYTEPPYVPAWTNAVTGKNQAFPLSAIQISISYRDASSNQIRSMTIVESLIDPQRQNNAPFLAIDGITTVYVPVVP